MDQSGGPALFNHTLKPSMTAGAGQEWCGGAVAARFNDSPTDDGPRLGEGSRFATATDSREDGTGGDRLRRGLGLPRRRRQAPALAVSAQPGAAGRSTPVRRTGQLIAVIGDQGRSDNADELAISRADVCYAAIEAALEGWQEWAMVLDADNYRWISLAQIQRRVNDAGLGSGNT